MSKRSAEKWQKFIPEDDGGFTLETYQDPTAILNNNKIDYNNYGDKKTPGKMGEGIRVASIPITIWEKWMQETNGAIQSDTNLLKKYLNDPDNKYFRTTPTRI